MSDMAMAEGLGVRRVLGGRAWQAEEAVTDAACGSVAEVGPSGMWCNLRWTS